MNLGDPKGNVGNQNYEFPADVYADDRPSIVTRRERFAVGFAVAPLLS